jgi:divalent metal cation (Fe/Co/Zn/Cd) transporter
MHEHVHPRAHGHSHGLVDRTIVRSRAGIRAVALSLAILTLTAAIQTYLYTRTLSVALLADLIHNFGDALTAVPLGIAFFLRSERGESPGCSSCSRSS